VSEVRPKAISIRQPWAWAVVHAGKDVENRSEAAVRVMAKVVGERIFIHASRSFNRCDFEEALDFIESLGVAPQAPEALEMGGVIGSAKIESIVASSGSPWFFGPRALRFVDPRPLPFFAVKGQLNLFYVTPPPG
jgi:hypothetical protein